MTAARFRMWHATANTLPGLAVGSLVAIYLGVLIEWDAADLRTLLWSTAIVAALIVPIGHWFERRMQRPIVRALEAEARGTASDAERRAGYLAALRLPADGLRWMAAWWLAGGVVAAAGLSIAQREWDGFRTLVILCGVGTGVAIVLPLSYDSLRRVTRPLLKRWADVAAQEAHGAAIVAPLRWKLVGPTAAVCVALTVFAALLAQRAALGPVEAYDVRAKAAFLAEVATRVPLDAGALSAFQEIGRQRRVADSLLRLDPQKPSGALTSREDAAIRAAVVRSGDSAALDTPNSFAWQRLDDDTLLVAMTPLRTLTAGLWSDAVPLMVFLLLALGASLGVTSLLVRDVSDATAELLSRVERVQSGDLRSVPLAPSDDELGVLAQAIAAMSASLRTTLARVSAAADRVEEASQQTAAVGSAVTAANTDQRAGIERAAASTQAIQQQASDIAESSETLTRSVEEAGSSVLELGAAAEQLNQTAQTLNGHVDEVSGSIEQMVRSVARVGEHTQVLADATLETSSSLADMTESMESVDRHAVETARLSAQVIELSEGGRAHVQRTRDGMEAIRTATDAAREVIDGLSVRAAGIGKIVDVIDDVADETNLLALNAAIIAAQAGDRGRAFSVVADEIKDLADRVLTSTKEIAEQIRAVQDDSRRAADAIRQGEVRVREGVDLSADAGAALEEITAAARDCGQRTDEIVAAVRAQGEATSHVGMLMERVNARVGEIRAAGVEQSQSNEVLSRSAVLMRDVAHQTLRTTEEQARGSARIRDGMEAVRDVVDRIHGALREQSDASSAAARFLEEIHARTRQHEDAAGQLERATGSLAEEASALRSALQHFRFGAEHEANESEVRRRSPG